MIGKLGILITILSLVFLFFIVISLGAGGFSKKEKKPFYNEKNTLSESIERLLAHHIFSEIILSDDNSNDGSDIIAKHYEDKNENIKYIKSSTNKGKGNALNNAKDHITTKFVVIHDADLEYYPEDLVEMFEKAKLNPQSLIIGSRFIGNKERVNIYRRTFIANKVMSLFFSFVIICVQLG